jgi:hypothetical protein
MTDRELMQQALDALEYASDQTKPENLHGCDCLICKTILALRERLAQPEQEPVAKYSDIVSDGKLDPRNKFDAPPQRQWVGLTDEEIKEIIGPWGDTPIKGYTRKLFDQIEAKLKEKNGG